MRKEDSSELTKGSRHKDGLDVSKGRMGRVSIGPAFHRLSPSRSYPPGWDLVALEILTEFAKGFNDAWDRANPPTKLVYVPAEKNSDEFTAISEVVETKNSIARDTVSEETEDAKTA